MAWIPEGMPDIKQYFILRIVYFKGSLFDSEQESWCW